MLLPHKCHSPLTTVLLFLWESKRERMQSERFILLVKKKKKRSEMENIITSGLFSLASVDTQDNGLRQLNLSNFAHLLFARE